MHEPLSQSLTGADASQTQTQTHTHTHAHTQVIYRKSIGAPWVPCVLGLTEHRLGITIRRHNLGPAFRCVVLNAITLGSARGVAEDSSCNAHVAVAQSMHHGAATWSRGNTSPSAWGSCLGGLGGGEPTLRWIGRFRLWLTFNDV